MIKKTMLSLVAVTTLISGSFLPCFAEGDTFQEVCLFPVRLVGSSVGTVVGVPEGAVKDGVRGSIKATKMLAGKLGNEDGKYQQAFGAMLAGPVGLVGGGVYGVFDGAWHGMKTGYEKPFSKEAFTFKDE